MLAPATAVAGDDAITVASTTSTEADVTGTTHGENIDRIAEGVYATLREQYDAGREEVLYAEVATVGGSRVETFLGLLFLAHRGQVRLQPDELSGDL